MVPQQLRNVEIVTDQVAAKDNGRVVYLCTEYVGRYLLCKALCLFTFSVNLAGWQATNRYRYHLPNPLGGGGG